MQTNLSYDLSITDAKIKCDTQCKKILSQKIILAWILKYSTPEFSDLDISEILSCIEGEPEISSIGVLPGHTNHPSSGNDQISGMSNESKIINEGFITYDIRFFVMFPAVNKRIRLLINLEAQNSFYPGYQIVTRGIFYDARMLSAQLGTEFSIPYYDDIKKVYSIWICMNAPNYIGNAISQYYIAKKDLVSGIPDQPTAYDKISVVIITLNEKQTTSHKLLYLLNILFCSKPYSEKKRILEQEFSIHMEYNEEKELTLMCNYSDYVEKRGIEKGMEKGMELGKRELIDNLLRNKLLPDDVIAGISGYSLEKIQSIRLELELIQ